MSALMFVDQPGYSSLLLRRTYPELVMPEGLISRAQEWLSSTAAKWSGDKKTWTFPSGATLTFGYLQYEQDKYRYQGAAFQFIGFDELTHFTESQYTYLFSRLRRLKECDVPLRLRAGSNPGGVGHTWVKHRFLVESHPKRTFIPANLKDNPYLDREEYVKSLENLDPVTRKQLRDGDWDVRLDGGLFQRSWFKDIESFPADFQIRVRFWDLAATQAKRGKDPDWTVGCLMARDWQGRVYVLDIQRFQDNPAGVEERIRDTAHKDGRSVQIRMEQEPGSSGKSQIDHYARNVLPEFDFRGVASTGSKELRARPFSASAYNGNVHVVPAAWSRDFFDELEGFPGHTAHDDQVDAASGAYNAIAAVPQRGNRPLTPKEKTVDEYEEMLNRISKKSNDPLSGVVPNRPTM